MKIINNQALAARNFIANINLSKFSKEIRIAIYKNLIELEQVVSTVQIKVDSARNSLFKGFEEDSVKVQILRDEYNNASTSMERKESILSELKEFDEFFKVEMEFNELANRFIMDESELSITKFDFNEFIDGITDSNINFSASDLHSIGFMFNNI